MLLVLVLLTVLMGLGIATMTGTLAQTQSREHVTRVSTMLRCLRAESANTGRKFHLSFDPATGKPKIGIETDPLTQPGKYDDYTQWWTSLADPAGTSKVVLCRRTGSDDLDETSVSLDESPDQKDTTIETLTFSPSGASDSARLVVLNDDPDHTWAVEITLNGVDGSVNTREMNLEEETIE